jgi:hypothetical protein
MHGMNVTQVSLAVENGLLRASIAPHQLALSIYLLIVCYIRAL